MKQEHVSNKRYFVWSIVFVCFLQLQCDNSRKRSFYHYNCHILSSRGELTTGRVYWSGYSRSAPEGWALYYKFDLENGQTYEGMSMGPKDHITKYPIGSKVTVVYLPSNPETNLELFYLANSPDYKRVRKTLLTNDKFKKKLKKISLYDYSQREWYDEMREGKPRRY